MYCYVPLTPSFASTVPSVAVKMKIFQELLTQLLLQHSSLSRVLPALKDVVREESTPYPSLSRDLVL